MLDKEALGQLAGHVVSVCGNGSSSAALQDCITSLLDAVDAGNPPY